MSGIRSSGWRVEVSSNQKRVQQHRLWEQPMSYKVGGYFPGLSGNRDPTGAYLHRAHTLKVFIGTGAFAKQRECLRLIRASGFLKTPEPGSCSVATRGGVHITVLVKIHIETNTGQSSIRAKPRQV